MLLQKADLHMSSVCAVFFDSDPPGMWDICFSDPDTKILTVPKQMHHGTNPKPTTHPINQQTRLWVMLFKGLMDCSVLFNKSWSCLPSLMP